MLYLLNHGKVAQLPGKKVTMELMDVSSNSLGPSFGFHMRLY